MQCDHKSGIQSCQVDFRQRLRNQLSATSPVSMESLFVYWLPFRLALDWRPSLHVHCLQRAGTLLLEGAQPRAEDVLVDREHKPRTSFIHHHGEVFGWTVIAPYGTDGKWSSRPEGVSPRGVRSGRSPRDGNGSVLTRRGRCEGRGRITDMY